MDVVDRSCIVFVYCSNYCVKMLVKFFVQYLNNVVFFFQFINFIIIMFIMKVKLLKILKDMVLQKVKCGQSCLEFCLCQFVFCFEFFVNQEDSVFSNLFVFFNFVIFLLLIFVCVIMVYGLYQDVNIFFQDFWGQVLWSRLFGVFYKVYDDVLGGVFYRVYFEIFFSFVCLLYWFDCVYEDLYRGFGEFLFIQWEFYLQ